MSCASWINVVDDSTIFNYYDNGQIKSVKYENDSLTSNYTFYENFRLKSYSYLDKRTGENKIQKFCENGNVIHSYFFVDSLVKMKSYHCNGEIWAEGKWVPKNLSYFGKWVTYYDTGQIKFKGSYHSYNEETKDLFYDSTKIGIWFYYNEDGTLKKKELYDTSGNLLSTELED
jgi:antitoxin component YwqK of YwqJK toxin-antitoxin module